VEAEKFPFIFLSLGSNRGDSRTIISGAIRDLTEKLEGIRVSSLYSTKAMYVQDQPDFLNCVVKADLPPVNALDFLDICQGIEARWGRERSTERKKGERSLDIDILIWGDSVVESPRLRIPHAGMRERKFVLIPLLELEPGLSSPDGQGPYIESLDALPEQGIYFANLSEYASIIP
jgi:2-amino-4-hydroxy-6-hydroxymethyldihydropteridine diphosphokinase